MSVNSILFQTAYGLREPSLLNLGKTMTDNYDGLAAYLAQDSETSATAVSDTVDLSLDKVKSKIVSELAAITAGAIGDHPDLADDYVVAVIGTGADREVRVWSRDELVELFGGTDEERKALREKLDQNPLLAFDSAEDLPPTSTAAGASELADKASAFVKTNQKLLELLGKYGHDPFQELAEA